MKTILLGLFLSSSIWAAQPMPLSDFEAVASSQTDQVMGPVGAAGDILQELVVTVTAAATSAVSIKDGGGSAIPIVPANAAIGVYSIRVGALSTSGAWKLTTAAGVSVLAVGRFK